MKGRRGAERRRRMKGRKVGEATPRLHTFIRDFISVGK